MTTFKGFAFLVLAAITFTTLSAETRCPGNVASVPLQIVNRHQFLIEVSVNHSGPYSFLFDTGTQITMVDLSLAAELHLSTQGSANVTSAGSSSSASFAQIDLLEVGSQSVANQTVLVYDFSNMNSTNRSIRGILGQDFLGQFDMLIDNAHGMLCLDGSTTLRASVKGQHIPLVDSAQSANSNSLPGQLIVAARIADGKRPIHLKLDSGANVSLLYDVDRFMVPSLFRTAKFEGKGVDCKQRVFSALPLQEVKIGSFGLSKVTFITSQETQSNANPAELDGLLPTQLFRRIFVNHADHFAVLEAW